MADPAGLKVLLWEPVMGKVGKAGDSEAGQEAGARVTKPYSTCSSDASANNV